MKNSLTYIIFLFLFVFFMGCSKRPDKESIKKEILNTEKAFEKMTKDKGVAEAFHFFADKNAVILRGNDSLITGKNNILKFYQESNNTNADVNWKPDFIDVSDCGNLAYSYGKYVWRIKNSDGKINEYKGIYHTIWKRQPDNSWKYVWD